MTSDRQYTPSSHYMLAKQAASELGVSIELVEGLVSNHQLPGVKQQNGRGNWITMVERKAVADLAAKMSG